MSEEKSPKPEAAAHAEPGTGGGGSKLPVIFGVLNLLLTVGIGAVVFLQFQKDKKHEAVSDIKVEAPAGEKAAEGEHGGGEHGGGEHAAAAEKPAEGGEHGGGEHGGAAAEKPNDKLLTLEQFTVNLSTSVGTPPRFARVVVAVELSSSEASAELTAKMAPVRNAIIDLFNSKRPADLQTGEGRNFLKEEIRNALNGLIVNGKVKGVFFSNFAVSS